MADTIHTISVGGRTLKLAPLTLGAVRKGKLLKVLKSFGRIVRTIEAQQDDQELPEDGSVEEALDGLVAILRESAIAADPSLNRDSVEALIDDMGFADIQSKLLPALHVIMRGSMPAAQDGDSGEAPSP